MDRIGAFIEDEINDADGWLKWRIKLPVRGVTRIVHVSQLYLLTLKKLFVKVVFGCRSGKIDVGTSLFAQVD